MRSNTCVKRVNGLCSISCAAKPTKKPCWRLLPDWDRNSPREYRGILGLTRCPIWKRRPMTGDWLHFRGSAVNGCEPSVTRWQDGFNELAEPLLTYTLPS